MFWTKREGRQAAGLDSFKENHQIWVTLSHDSIRVSKHLRSQTVSSELGGARAPDAADNCQSRVFSLHCYSMSANVFVLCQVSCLFNRHCQKDKQWFLLFFFPPLMASNFNSCRPLTWCHPDSSWDLKIRTDAKVWLNVYSIKYLCQVADAVVKMNNSCRLMGVLHIHLAVNAMVE